MNIPGPEKGRIVSRLWAIRSAIVGPSQDRSRVTARSSAGLSRTGPISAARSRYRYVKRGALAFERFVPALDLSIRLGVDGEVRTCDKRILEHASEYSALAPLLAF